MAVNERPAESSEKNDPHGDAAAGSSLIHAQRLAAEVCGTFLLVTVDGGGAMISALSHGEPTPTGRSAAAGLLVMAMIYAMGDVSGAHFNPAVTFAFALRRVFPWRRVPIYWSAQLGGALMACAVLRLLFGDVEHLGATLPRMTEGPAFGIEVLATYILVCIVLGTATRHRVIGANAAIASGAVVALDGILARSVSGASMNPARSLAPALASGALAHVWIYLLAPLLGAALATVTMGVVHKHKHDEEKKAACGEKK